VRSVVKERANKVAIYSLCKTRKLFLR